MTKYICYEFFSLEFIGLDGTDCEKDYRDLPSAMKEVEYLLRVGVLTLQVVDCHGWVHWSSDNTMFVVFHMTNDKVSDFSVEESFSEAQRKCTELQHKEGIYCAGFGPISDGSDW